EVKFRETQGNAERIGQFLRELPSFLPELSKLFKRVVCLFGSSYVCEKLFSVMNFNKSKYCSRLSDAHIQAFLRASTALKTNMNHLCQQKLCQASSRSKS
ncbi:hypothetical protein LDENG_00214660, partial [Lucifuga dentata]